jgi:monovalent cation:H+ antiporter-2, CPA2 family
MGAVTLAQLAVTVAALGALGLAGHRFGLSPIPAYLLAGLLLGPGEWERVAIIQPSPVTDFAAQIGLVFLLFFLGLEFSYERLSGSGRHAAIGGTLDLVVNGGLGLLVGLIAFGPSLAAVVLAAAIYISSSAVIVKGLIDFRRLGDDETNLVLAILVFEDLAIAFVLGIVGGAGGELADTLHLVLRVLLFITAAVAASRYLARPLDRALDRMPREFFLLLSFAFVVGAAAVAHKLGVSEAIGALMAGVVLSETSVRADLEERFFSVRDLFAALFFFAFGLTIELDAIPRVGWLVALAVAVSVAGKLGTGYTAGRLGGFTRRQSLNVGAALVAHGEFTIIVAELASRNPAIAAEDRAHLVAFAGLYVLVTALLGVVLMKESKRAGRILFPARRTLRPEEI